ncbi:MAG TPA: DNA polymerase III subunit delta [Candidatus Saccharimonadales bacterium]|nr:DNA polymerase III subunit delta [Candidatus Saccharimonadales bacterium]
MIITLTGESRYAIHQALWVQVLTFIAKHGDHSVDRIDGETFDPRNLAELLQGVSLFAQERLVVLKNASKNKPLWEALASIEQPGATLVIVEPSMDKRSRTYKMLKQKSDFREYGVPADTELIAWVGSSVKTLGGTISPADARFLMERTGRDQWQLAQEIEKLVSFSPQITHKSIETLVEQTPEGNAFELLDAALGGNVPRVVALVDQLKTQEDPYKLFGLVASQVHTLAVVAAAGQHSPDHIASEAGLHPFVVRKTVSVAKRLGKSRIAHIASDVARCDQQLKTTGFEPWDLLKLCLQKIAAK